MASVPLPSAVPPAPVARCRNLPRVSNRPGRRRAADVSRPVACRVRLEPNQIKEKWWESKPQPNLLEVSSLQGLVDVLEDNKDRLVLVDFYAPWCNACKSLYPKLSQLCAQNPHVVVVKINWEEQKKLCKTLGVKVLPYFHAYHGSMGRVAAFSSSITKIQRLRDCMNLFGQPYCDLGSVNVKASLPEFDDLPTPSDATMLTYPAGFSQDESDSEVPELPTGPSEG